MCQEVVFHCFHDSKEQTEHVQGHILFKRSGCHWKVLF